MGVRRRAATRRCRFALAVHAEGASSVPARPGSLAAADGRGPRRLRSGLTLAAPADPTRPPASSPAPITPHQPGARDADRRALADRFAGPDTGPAPSPSAAPDADRAAAVGLQSGDKGPQVAALQKRLTAVGFLDQRHRWLLRRHHPAGRARAPESGRARARRGRRPAHDEGPQAGRERAAAQHRWPLAGGRQGPPAAAHREQRQGRRHPQHLDRQRAGLPAGRPDLHGADPFRPVHHLPAGRRRRSGPAR